MIFYQTLSHSVLYFSLTKDAAESDNDNIEANVLRWPFQELAYT